jgi:tripartite-type tricarboxylate transporter receptor subunit TctC
MSLIPLLSLTLASTAALLPLAALAATQDSYPQKSITLLVGFPPGGSGDFVGRLVGQKLSESLRQPVVVENRGGANGLLAASAVAAAAANGYTLYITSMGLTTNPHLYSKNRLDPVKTFTAISLIANVPNVLVTSLSVPGKDLRELLELARSRSNPLTVATVGQGAPGHLISELLQRTAKVKFEHIPYKGSGPALLDVIGQRVDMSFPSVIAAFPPVNSGKLRGIAVTGTKRSSLLPEVPTFGEAGMSDITGGWYALVGPANLPKAVVARLSHEIDIIMKMPDVREQFAANGADPVGSSPTELSRFIAEDYKRWGDLIKSANIKADAE